MKRVVGEGRFEYLETKDGKKITGDACIVATGGFSYQTTGSTGDGYRFAEETGHQVTDIMPALVPLELKETYVKELQGLSLRNVTAAIYDGKKKLYEDFGEMLFTHYGVIGHRKHSVPTLNLCSHTDSFKKFNHILIVITVKTTV